MLIAQPGIIVGMMIDWFSLHNMFSNTFSILVYLYLFQDGGILKMSSKIIAVGIHDEMEKSVCVNSHIL